MHLDRDYRVFDNDTSSWVKRYNLGHPVDSSKFKFLKSSKESDYSFLPVRLSHFQAIQKFYPVQRYNSLLTFELFWFEVKSILSNWSKAQLTTSVNLHYIPIATGHRNTQLELNLVSFGTTGVIYIWLIKWSQLKLQNGKFILIF